MSEISDLIDRYWQFAYAEGRENRRHDTENGDAQECRTSIDEAIMLLNDRIEELERDNADLPQAPWPASEWAINRIAELEHKLAEARADALEEAAALVDLLPRIQLISPDHARATGPAECAFAIRALKSGGANG